MPQNLLLFKYMFLVGVVFLPLKEQCDIFLFASQKAHMIKSLFSGDFLTQGGCLSSAVTSNHTLVSLSHLDQWESSLGGTSWPKSSQLCSCVHDSDQLIKLNERSSDISVRIRAEQNTNEIKGICVFFCFILLGDN